MASSIVTNCTPDIFQEFWTSQRSDRKWINRTIQGDSQSGIKLVHRFDGACHGVFPWCGHQNEAQGHWGNMVNWGVRETYLKSCVIIQLVRCIIKAENQERSSGDLGSLLLKKA